MADILSKKARSKRMSLIRSRWTKPELWVHNSLKGRKINHKMHPRMIGSPDIIIPKIKLAIFIQGCFWHKCKKCYKKPKNNKLFWQNKVRINVKRDNRNQRNLRISGWKVMVVWEHSIKRHKPQESVRVLLDKLDLKKP